MTAYFIVVYILKYQVIYNGFLVLKRIKKNKIHFMLVVIYKIFVVIVIVVEFSTSDIPFSNYIFFFKSMKKISYDTCIPHGQYPLMFIMS
ncbi:hypothetical protein KUTeg_023556 [Tegillarca granosa]|uniref:Uncharacterized protein n=1 Tax=Tegillarca granosa TaxID=220873 RepID=A0ABQ9E202_TEGGR|nr:hypothetical protein KUTeg_023556 [Tegillarca granosa]